MLYEEVKKLCAGKGISVARLEKECGLGNATIRRWESSSPTVASLKKVADYFGIPVCELVEHCDG